jgi:hypothetical protein
LRRQGVDVGSGFGACGVDLDEALGGVAHQSGGHLGFAAVLDADE